MAPVQVNEPADGVRAILLDRPRVRNALDEALIDALEAALRDTGDDRDVGAVVLGSSDQRWFCAGIDLTLAPATRARLSDRLYALYGQIVALRKPVVAALGGPAVGGGAQLALAADLRVGMASATFRIAGPGHGLAVAAWALPSLVGRARALDLCLTMRAVGGEEAHRIGLLDRLVPDAFAGAVALATQLAGVERGAAARAKALTWGDAAPSALAAERRGNLLAWDGAIDDARRLR